MQIIPKWKKNSEGDKVILDEHCTKQYRKWKAKLQKVELSIKRMASQELTTPTAAEEVIIEPIW